MFLLLLMGLGAARVKAQVRIGGDTAPNAAAVLDLNANDTNTGTKGLALPRVALTSDAMQLTSGTANLLGMLVYNTTATLGAGIYYWNGVLWVQLIATKNATPTLFSIVLDTMYTGSTPTAPSFVNISSPSTKMWDWCYTGAGIIVVPNGDGQLRIYSLSANTAGVNIRCFRRIT